MAELRDESAEEASDDVLAIVITDDQCGDPMVRVAGEIDLGNADQLRTALAPILAAAPPRIGFEMSEVGFIDSSGLAVLIDAANRVGEILVHEPSRAVLRVIEVTGLSDTLRTAP